MELKQRTINIILIALLLMFVIGVGNEIKSIKKLTPSYQDDSTMAIVYYSLELSQDSLYIDTSFLNQFKNIKHLVLVNRNDSIIRRIR